MNSTPQIKQQLIQPDRLLPGWSEQDVDYIKIALHRIDEICKQQKEKRCLKIVK